MPATQEQVVLGPAEAFMNRHRITYLGSQPVRWRLQEGVAPVAETLHIRPDDKPQLEEELEETPFGEHILGFFTPRHGRVLFNHLFVTDLPPGPNPHIAAVTLSDRRWLWPYKHILRRYNMRRKVGTRRAPNPVAELRQLVPDIQYAPYSLRNPEGAPPGAKWTAVEVLEDVLQVLVDFETATIGRQAPGFFIHGGVGQFIRALPVEDLVLDDRADQAVARIMEYIPGAGITVDPDGRIRVYSQVDGTEAQIVGDRESPTVVGPPEPLGPEIVGDGHVDFVRQVARRPTSVKVLFTYECEVRFDFAEQSGPTVVVLSERDKEQLRRLTNVVPLPDFSLQLGGEEVAQGTYVELHTNLFNAWGAPPGIGQVIDHQVIRRAFMPFLDLWGPILLAGQLAPDSDWMARVSALMQHYRSTFKIPQRWMDRILELRPYRVSTIDVATGTRGVAQAYANYAIVASQRAFFGFGVNDRQQAFHVLNVDGYPANDTIDEATKPIPARVSIPDSDQGIISLEFLPDPGKVHTTFLPSKVTGDTIPTGDVQLANRGGRPIAFDALSEGMSDSSIPELESGHKAALIVTAIPAAPNSTGQLFEIEIEPDHIQALVPPHVRRSLQNAAGPPMEVRVPASVETARVRWKDDRATDIAALFGVIPGPAPNVKDLIVNLEAQNVPPILNATLGASLEAIAGAVAARVYTQFVDRHMGQMSMDMRSEPRPAGTMSEVVYELAPDGKLTCQISLPEVPQYRLSLFNFLDDGTRSLIMKLVQGRPAA